MTRTGLNHAITPQAALLSIAALCFNCGGGSAHNNTSALPITTSGNNVQPITVNSGPANNYANGVFTSITVCVPFSSICQTISEVLVDNTGSYGLRLLSSAGNGALTLSLPAQNGTGGNPVAECAPELPAAPNPAPSLSGSMVFGIGTQSNNDSAMPRFLPSITMVTSLLRITDDPTLRQQC